MAVGARQRPRRLDHGTGNNLRRLAPVRSHRRGPGLSPAGTRGIPGQRGPVGHGKHRLLPPRSGAGHGTARRNADSPPGHAKFFLHVIPVDVSDLPNRRKPWKFDNLDFFFREYPPYRAQAIAVRELPAYDIAGIRTGQFTKEANHYHTLWAGEVSFDEAPSRNRHVPAPSRGGQWDGLEKKNVHDGA